MIHPVYVSCVILQVCGIILLQNTSGLFYKTNVINFVFNVYLPAAMSFMAAGGIIFGIKQERRPFFRISDDDVSPNLIDTIYKKSFSNFSLPSAWFEEVHNNFNVDYYNRHVRYCTMLLIYAIFCAFIEILWSVKVAGRVRKLIPLATTIMLPNDNKRERTNAVVLLMIRKIKDNKSFLFLVYVEFMLFLLNTCCFIIEPVNPRSNQYFPVHLNGSEWIVNCGRQVTSRDVHILIKCPHNYTDFSTEYRSICIVPNDNIYFILHFGSMLCFGLIAVATFVLLIMRMYSLAYQGLDKMNDVVLMRLLRMNIESKKHGELIDAFERTLDERRSARMNRTSFAQQKGAVFNKALEKVTFPIGIYDPD